jgi:hypothetical protein
LRQHFIAIEVRHHHVEQNEIKNFPRDTVECGSAVCHLNNVMAFALQTARQQLACRLGIIDDQDAARSGVTASER